MAKSNRRPASFRDLGDGDVGVWVAYEDRGHAKGLPSARWDKGLGCWRVRARFIFDVEQLVEFLNGGAKTTVVSAFTALFKALPERLRQPAYRSLAKVAHPDTGGDEEIAKALMLAWTEVNG